MLRDIQQLELGLVGYLSNRAKTILKNSAIINAITLLGLAAFSVLTLRVGQQNQLRANHDINHQLTTRQDQLRDTKNTLLSLMEDLWQEKDTANVLANQLQLSNKELQQFVYTVSHDLKAPLVTIGGFSYQLYRELETKLSEKQAHRLRRIQENVTHMENLLSDLLLLSKVVHKDIEVSGVDVENVIEKQCRVLESSIKSSCAKITVNSPLRTILANERLISQCVLNLLTNAIKYRDTQRPLNIVFKTESNEKYTSLSVSDNGQGIRQEYQDRVFKIFERMGQEEGTGIGLTIVKSIMEKHTGKVELTSQQGIGSEFRLMFPNTPTTVLAI